jgi:hypothetical protein
MIVMIYFGAPNIYGSNVLHPIFRILIGCTLYLFFHRVAPYADDS